ncbi:MAG: IS1634 family transposase [Leadbetterella sp.]
MYFKSVCRINPVSQKWDSYYRIVESYRNSSGRVCHRTILNIGFIDSSITPEQLNLVARCLTDMYQQKTSIFPQTDPIVVGLVTEYWSRIKKENKLDLTLYAPDSRMVESDTIRHNNVREVGAEWICYNAWHQLGLDKVLVDLDFTESEIQLAQTQIISRAVYPGSELATSKWIQENSAITEITGYDLGKINKDRLYRNALKLNNIKTELEQHLSIKTNELFDIQDKIVLYDLTNTYFEGEKRNSSLAKFGRSKEKRSDCRLVVLALVVNMYGFIKHSSVHEGNFSDSSGLDKVIQSLDSATTSNRPLIVLDAGIATKENLALIRSKGYHYLCVSRTKLKNYKFDTNSLATYLETKSKKQVVLKKISTEDNTDFCMEIQSEAKSLKERAMKSQFDSRFEAELEKIHLSIHKKGGVKLADKVNQRIGRAKQKYPSVQGKYDIELSYDSSHKMVQDMKWTLNEQKEKQANDNLGRYFIRTSLDMKDEVLVWNVYNTIREIESTFRTLKSDLDLRPIYHKNDASTVAHLNLGLLAYWLVNTIRCQLKTQGIHHNWTEIVRIGNTQKVITTIGTNKAEKEITVRKCSEPEQKLKQIQDALNIKHKPFTKLKSVVHKPKLKNKEPAFLQSFSSA